jgi:hypothetical protein
LNFLFLRTRPAPWRLNGRRSILPFFSKVSLCVARCFDTISSYLTVLGIAYIILKVLL